MSSFFQKSGSTSTVENSIQTDVDAAAASAAAAEAAQAASETAKAGSETAKTGSETAKTSSETARDASITAQLASEAARDTAVGYRDTAGTHKDAAASSATSAATSASTATTKASEASTSAATASTKAGEASTSAASAASSLSSFQSVYRSGATDPTDSLDAGDLFYNSSIQTLKVYTGSGWEQGVTAGSGFATISGATFTGDVTVPNLITSGNVDGRDVSVDGTKLDGIEASADVTDTTNVVAALTAGTNVTIAADGTVSATASNATVSADGLMSSTDKTKLDGIESGATADQSASEILTSVKTVDGAASGLDADLLDGQEGSYYLDGNNFTNLPAGYSGWTVSDGTNSENVANTDTVTFSGAGNATVAYSTASNTLTVTATASELADDASPQLAADLDTNGNAILFGSSKWAIELDTGDNDLLFKYNGTTVFKLASSGAITSADDVTAFGSP